MPTTTQRREHFEKLITAAEVELRQNPRRYNLKVTMLALLGYSVIFGMLLLLLTIAGGLGWAAFASSTLLILLIKTKFIIVLLVMIYVLFRALWVKFGEPSGYVLKPKEHPLLFTELKQLSKQLKSPRVHQVILTAEYNAALVQTPRLGIFGWYKNTLILGVQLLMSMSPEQSLAVIAHELGHLSGKHSRFSGWIYRVRLSWQRIMSSLALQKNLGGLLLRRFFDWYAPTFAAYSFALARANEYAADAIAVQLTSSQTVAEALINAQVINSLVVTDYWQPFVKQAEEIPEPQGLQPFSRLLSFLENQRFAETAVQEQLQKALAIHTGHFDTHPALNDRLSAIRGAIKPPAAAKVCAAQHWFGPKLTHIVAHFDQQWYALNATKWKERYQYFTSGRKQLAELKSQPLAEMSAKDMWQLACLAEEFNPEQDCLPLFELYKAHFPDDAKADFVIGRLLLVRNDATGVDYLVRAIAQQQNLKLNACSWLIDYYRQHHDSQAADYWQREAENQMDYDAAAKLERDTLSAHDTLVKPDPAKGVEQLAYEQIRDIKGIKRAWLAEKPMQQYPEIKTYVLAFEKRWLKSEKALVQILVSRLQLDSVCFVVMKNGKQKKIAAKVIRSGVKVL